MAPSWLNKGAWPLSVVPCPMGRWLGNASGQRQSVAVPHWPTRLARRRHREPDGTRPALGPWTRPALTARIVVGASIRDRRHAVSRHVNDDNSEVNRMAQSCCLSSVCSVPGTVLRAS